MFCTTSTALLLLSMTQSLCLTKSETPQPTLVLVQPTPCPSGVAAFILGVPHDPRKKPKLTTSLFFRNLDRRSVLENQYLLYAYEACGQAQLRVPLSLATVKPWMRGTTWPDVCSPWHWFLSPARMVCSVPQADSSAGQPDGDPIVLQCPQSRS